MYNKDDITVREACGRVISARYKLTECRKFAAQRSLLNLPYNVSETVVRV